MIRIAPNLEIPPDEIRMEALRARGPGGQHINKVASAVHLRFDVRASSLPAAVKQRLLRRRDRRITRQGVIVIKAETHRSLQRNRADALERLARLIRSALHGPKRRIPTRPTTASRQRRIRTKRHRAKIKALRRSPAVTGE